MGNTKTGILYFCTKSILKLTSYRSKLIFRSLFFAATLFIIASTAVPNLNDPDTEVGSNFLIRPDYVFHFTVFFVWGLLLRLAIPLSFAKTMWHLIGIIAIAFIFTYLSEFFQVFIPGRAFNPKDLLLNFAGLILALGFHRILPGIWRRLYAMITENS